MPALTALLPACLRRPTARQAAALDLAALVGSQGWSRLPTAVQSRFAAGHPDTRYAGQMTMRCTRIGRLYARLSGLFGGPLAPINASGVPTLVQVRNDSQGGMIWERCFQLDAQPGRTVRSTKEIGSDGGLLERTDGGLSMSLDVFEEDGSLVFRSRRYWLVLGRVRLPVPALLSPGVCRVAHTDLDNGLFRFTLTMVHPLWGETFHQSGVFADAYKDQQS